MATYPGAVVSFSSKRDLVDIDYAADINNVQNEIVAIESALGTSPVISVTPNAANYVSTSSTFATVSARIANVENGIVADTHTQYIHKTGGDTIAPAAGTVGLVVRAATSQTANLIEFRNSAGSLQTYVDNNGALKVSGGQTVVTTAQAASTVTTLAAGQAAVVGTATNYSREDHKHALPAADPVASTAGFRTLGTGAQQAAAGNHTHTALDLTTYTEKAVSVAGSSATTTLNLSTGTTFTVSLTTNTAITFSNVPASGKAASITVIAVQDATGGRTITWPAGTVWGGAAQPTQDTTAGHTSIYSLFTVNGGATWYAFLSGKGMA